MDRGGLWPDRLLTGPFRLRRHSLAGLKTNGAVVCRLSCVGSQSEKSNTRIKVDIEPAAVPPGTCDLGPGGVAGGRPRAGAARSRGRHAVFGYITVQLVQLKAVRLLFGFHSIYTPRFLWCHAWH